MNRRPRTLLRGLAAAGGLAGLVVGVPVLLAQEVGWPLPTAVPSWDEVSRAITTGTVRDATIIKTIAVLVWLAWADFTSGVVAELIGIARGRVAVRAGGLRTAQELAARLVTTVAVAVSLLARPASGAAAPVDLRLAVADATAQPLAGSIGDGDGGGAVLDPPVVHTSGVAAGATSGAPTPAAANSVHEVERGDTLWDLAERYLGDGMRWRDLRAANVGREQPDGERIRADTEAVNAGWTLLIPDRSPADAAGPGSGQLAGDGLVVEAGDTLWDLADEHLGDPYAWPRLHEENRGDPQPDGDALEDPDLIQPGWTLDLPPPPDAPVPSAKTVESLTSGEPPVIPDAPDESVEPEPRERDAEVLVPAPPPPAASAAPSPREAREVAELDAEESPEGVPVVPVAAAGTLAAGVVLTLDRLRRARLRRREAGRRIPLPDGEAAIVEQGLRAAADPAAARLLDHALRELSSHLAQLDEPPEVEHVTHDATTVTVHLQGEPGSPPTEWELEAPRVWSRHQSSDLDASASTAGAPSRLPTLVTLGRTSEGRVVLLNLAHGRHLHVVGAPETAERLLASWALELATTPRADALDVLAVGVPGLPSGLERLQLVDDAELLSEHLPGPDASVQSTVPDTVVLSSELPTTTAHLLSATCQRGAGVVAVTASTAPHGAAVVLHLDGEGRATVEPLGIEVRSLDIGQDALPLTAKLLEQALHDPDQLVPLPSEPDDVEPSPIDSTDDAREYEPPLALLEEPLTEVRVLGPVEVVGAAQPFRTNKTVELVVYLALRRSGADTDTLLEALWPAQEPRPARLYTEASRARKALGAAADGAPHLPDAELGRYRLRSTVSLDHERFAAEVRAARQEPARAAEHLRRALELVRGVPLSATATEYAWATNEGYRLAQEVVDAAHELAELSLEAGHWADCIWAAERGLLANPLAEMLVRDLMKAAAATGNTARAHSVMTRLRRQIAEDGDANDADDWLHPETLELYESLTGAVV